MPAWPRQRPGLAWLVGRAATPPCEQDARGPGAPASRRHGRVSGLGGLAGGPGGCAAMRARCSRSRSAGVSPAWPRQRPGWVGWRVGRLRRHASRMLAVLGTRASRPHVIGKASKMLAVLGARASRPHGGSCQARRMFRAAAVCACSKAGATLSMSRLVMPMMGLPAASRHWLTAVYASARMPLAWGRLKAK